MIRESKPKRVPAPKQNGSQTAIENGCRHCRPDAEEPRFYFAQWAEDTQYSNDPRIKTEKSPCPKAEWFSDSYRKTAVGTADRLPALPTREQPESARLSGCLTVVYLSPFYMLLSAFMPSFFCGASAAGAGSGLYSPAASAIAASEARSPPIAGFGAAGAGAAEGAAGVTGFGAGAGVTEGVTGVTGFGAGAGVTEGVTGVAGFGAGAGVTEGAAGVTGFGAGAGAGVFAASFAAVFASSAFFFEISAKSFSS